MTFDSDDEYVTSYKKSSSLYTDNDDHSVFLSPPTTDNYIEKYLDSGIYSTSSSQGINNSFYFNTPESNVTIDWNCCIRKCLHQWTPADILSIQDLHSRKSKEEVREHLLHLFKHAKKTSNAWTFTVRNKELCTKSVRQIFKITDHSFNKYRKLRESDTIPVHGNIGRLSSSQKTSNALSWFRNFVESVGEKQSNSTFTHLPNYLTIKELYNSYKSDMIIGEQEYVGYSQFCSIWKKHMSDVKTPTYTTLGKCTTCTGFETRRKQIQTQEELLAYKKDKSEHFKLIGGEREALTHRKSAAMVILIFVDTNVKRTIHPHIII